jgi:protein-S-isoprenylcysteine O-methyltransferase Ste14
MTQPLIATYAAWAAWVVSWGLASFWSSRAEKTPGTGNQILYRLLMGAGGVMIFAPQLNVHPLWHMPEALAWAMAALTAAGFLFCWWARIHLGLLWSSSVTKKSDHRVVDTGPYRLVRHPIYTGLIFASYAVAFERGTVSALIGATVMLLGCTVKARLEERFLRQELGRDAYDAYAARVPMLIPFL